jgi:hypothetical protein
MAHVKRSRGEGGGSRTHKSTGMAVDAPGGPAHRDPEGETGQAALPDTPGGDGG